jgi:short-subunit dehydrogenase
MAETTRTALITGASAGIGAALARVFAANGFDLVLTARRADRLEALAQEISTAHGRTVRVIAADLSDPAAPARLFDEVAAAGITIDALVNNAGYGLPGGLLHSSWEQHRDFIQVMVTAIAELCYRFAPGMVQRQRGWIVNVGSVAGLVPGSAGHTLYGAVKSLVIKFSQSLALELQPAGVHVTALCPGFTYSEFHDVNGMRPTVSQLPKFMWMDADTVARQAFDAVMRGDIVHVNGAWNKTLVTLVRSTPDWLVNVVLQRFSKKFRRV